MTTEQKKDLVRRYYQEVWTNGNLDFVDQVFTDDYVNCDPATPGGRLEGRQPFKELVKNLRGAFQDMVMTIDHQHVDGEVVVSEWTAQAVHRGSLMGISPTGRPSRTTGITISCFRGDRIREDRAIWDLFGLLARLGALPHAPAA
jgi:ketosteroid isomerase-like protein